MLWADLDKKSFQLMGNDTNMKKELKIDRLGQFGIKYN